MGERSKPKDSSNVTISVTGNQSHNLIVAQYAHFDKRFSNEVNNGNVKVVFANSNLSDIRQVQTDYIYYPEFEIESMNGSLKLINYSPNHILNLKLLLFLCDCIVLPPSHLIETSLSNIILMGNCLRQFFDDGKIVTTRYFNDIQDYFSSKVEQSTGGNEKAKIEAKVKQINENLFVNTNVIHHTTNEAAQVGVFSERLQHELALLSDSDCGFDSKSSGKLLNRIDALLNRTGGHIYSRQYRIILDELFSEGYINEFQYKKYLHLESAAYYHTGILTMNTRVSYNRYFEILNLEKRLSVPEKSPSRFVSPYFLLKLFNVFGISQYDIMDLTSKDYDYLKSQIIWKHFLKTFKELSRSSDDINSILEKQTSVVRKIERIKHMSFLLRRIPGNHYVPPWILNSLARPVSQKLGMPLVLSQLKLGMENYEKEVSAKNSALDNIILHLAIHEVPLYAFCEKLKFAISENL
ncbi:MAG: hypothetical protein FWG87_10260 [Defluviitaleaceae bacterium]|nr:hypothetical protein [Defluviitaleaceae bacterium]